MSNRQPRRERALKRRDFLKAGGGAVAGAAALPVLARTDTAGGASEYPAVDVAPLADLAPGAAVAFNYPDASSPALLIRLPAPAEGGVGDDASVVAFSGLCTHKGCTVRFNAERGMLVCPCHWSTFDPSKGGRLVIGQASHALPRIELRVHDGMVQAVSVQGLIYGRHVNVL